MFLKMRENENVLVLVCYLVGKTPSEATNSALMSTTSELPADRGGYGSRESTRFVFIVVSGDRAVIVGPRPMLVVEALLRCDIMLTRAMECGSCAA